MKNRIFSLLIAVVVIGSLAISAAAHEAPDLSQNGTITFTMDWNNTPLDTGSLSMYRVGDIVEDDGNYSFALIEKLQSYPLSLENLADRDLVEALARLAKDEKLTEISAPIRDGEAVFTDVVCGLYVVVQDEDDASQGFAAISPFLISMPKYENGHYETNVTADPKVPLATVPNESEQPGTTKPTEPRLPQTGQLNWPVPVLAVVGLVLFAAGWILRFGCQKESYEK